MQVSISIWAVIIGIGSIHGFFLSAILLGRNRGYKTSNLWFGLIIAIFSYCLLEFTLLLSGNIRYVIHIFSGYVPLMFLLGPFLWFFTKRNLGGGGLRKIEYLHFLPALGVLISFIPYYLLAGDIKLDILEGLYGQGETIPGSILGFNIAFFIHLGAYILLSKRQLIKYEEPRASFKKIEKRVNTLVLSMIGLFVISFLSFVFFLFPLKWRLEVHYSLILIFSFLIYVFSYRVLFSKEEQTYGQQSYGGKKTDFDPELSKRLVSFLEEKKPFLDPDLKLQSLAKELEISAHQLSQLVNQEFDTNFSGLVNELRVEEAQNLLKENGDEKLLAIAFDSGFSNQANFIRVFKQFTGMTPSDYRETLKK